MVLSAELFVKPEWPSLIGIHVVAIQWHLTDLEFQVGIDILYEGIPVDGEVLELITQASRLIARLIAGLDLISLAEFLDDP